MRSVISLFSGAGGFDYGFEAAGFDIRVALEMDHTCCESLRAGRAWSVIEGDLLATPTDRILAAAGLEVGEVDVLIGGPPCQPFSKSGWWASGDSQRLNDPRAGTLGGYLRVLRDVRPRAFVLENVEGLAFSGKDEGLRLLLEEIAQINRETGTNYQPTVNVLNAANYGVPQTRTRVFIVASADGTPFRAPEATHAEEAKEQVLPVLPWKTAWDAIGHLKPDPGEDLAVRGKWADLLPSIPEGHNYLWHTDRMGGMPLFGWRRRYWNFLLKLAKNRPSWTIQAQPGPATGPFHWDNRLLSAAELKALQTFPASAVLLGSRADVQRQLGNAVPSLLAEVVAREVATQLLGRASYLEGPSLMPEVRRPIPSPERVRSVPRKYRGLAGEHSEHPGTGRGALYAAQV